MINVGIIGTGFGVMGHLAAFKSLPGSRVVALCARNKEKLEALAAQHGIARTYTSATALMDDPELDTIIIATPNHLHKAMLSNALTRKKHIILEKPAGVTSGEVETMMRQTKAYPASLFVNHALRFHPVVGKMKELVAAGVIGSIQTIQIANLSGYGSDPAFPYSWIHQKKFGGGQVLLIGTHLIDLARYVLDMPDLRRGLLLKRTVKPSRPDENDKAGVVDADEQFSVLTETSNWVSLQLFNTSHTFGTKTFIIKLLGDAGILDFDETRGLYHYTANDKPPILIDVPDPLPHVKAGRSFISKSVKYFAASYIDYRSGKTQTLPACTLGEAYENLKYLEEFELTKTQ